MTRSPTVLAALASAAVRGLDPVSVRAPQTVGGDMDVAVVQDDLGRRWVVRAPRRAAAGAVMESEIRLLQNLHRRVPFSVPRVAGSAPLPEGGRCVVYPYLPGSPLHPGEIPAGPGVAPALGQALAALHDLAPELVEDAGLPVYEAEEYRLRRLSELDRAASTGSVPTSLLARWEQALEDVGTWRFVPTPVHGDLVAEHVLVEDDRVAAVLDWGEAKVADPADDLAWLAVGAEPQVLDAVLESYVMSRRDQPDRRLPERARLAGELALTRWLLHGVKLDDAGIVEDAMQMLADLEAAVGGERL